MMRNFRLRSLQVFVFMLVSLLLAGCSDDNSSANNGVNSTLSSKIKVDPLTRLIEGEVTVSGFTATAVHIHEGAEGVEGSIIITLTQDSTDSNKFLVPAGARFSVSQYADYLVDGTYINAHSAANPAGEERIQLWAVTIDTDNVDYSALPNVSGYIMIAGFVGTNAHIHTGLAGSTGGISVTLVEDLTTPGRFNLPLGATVSEDEFNAGQLYFNVHSDDFLSGHIREQIVPAGVKVLGVELTAAEASATNPSGVSAGTATGYVTVNTNLTPATFEASLAYSGITATLAHVHTDNGGGVVFNLNPAAGSGTASGTLDATQLGEFNAGQYYFNLHTTAYPGGELRGQVTPTP